MGEWDVPHAGHMESADHIYFQNMTMNEVKERLKKDDTIIIPVGSTEADGAHACFGEDTFLVTRMAEAVGATDRLHRRAADLVRLASLSSPRDAGYRDRARADLLLADQLRHSGVLECRLQKADPLNGHGQEWVIPTAIHQFNKKYQVPAILLNLNWYYAIPQYLKTKDQGGSFDTPFIHADETETSFSWPFSPR